MLVSGAILLSPIILPAMAVDHAATAIAEAADFRELKAGVERGELASLQRCVEKCDGYLAGDASVQRELRREAVNKLIALDSPALPDSLLPAMLVAYSRVAWTKDTSGNWRLDDHNVTRGWELAERYRSQADGGSSKGKILEEMAKNLFVVRLLQLPPEAVPGAFERCVTGDLLPEHPEQESRNLLCKYSYRSYHRIRVGESSENDPPASLQERWDRDSTARWLDAHEARWLAASPQNRRMAQGVAAEEPEALAWCVMHCPDIAHSDSRALRQDQQTLKRVAARKLIALDAGGAVDEMPQARRLAMLEAYQNWFWQWGTRPDPAT